MTVFNGPPGCEARHMRIAFSALPVQDSYSVGTRSLPEPLSARPLPEEIAPVEALWKRRRFMREVRRPLADQFSHAPLDRLLTSLLESGPVRLTLSQNGMTLEAWGSADTRLGPEWLTITIGDRPDQLHIRRETLQRVQFTDTWGMDKSVHFFNNEDHLFLQCTLLETAEDSQPCRLTRLATFFALRAKYNEGVWLH